MRVHRSLFLFRSSSALIAALVGATLSSCGGGGGSGGSGVPGQVVMLTTTALSGDTGVFYGMHFEANFPNPPGIYAVTAGTLPAGLTLDIFTGELSGFPRQTGTFHFEIAARDGVDLSLPPGRDATFSEDRATYTVQIDRGLPNILPQTPMGATYRNPYAYQIDVAGGTPPYTFVQTGGVLPAGITVGSSGLLSNFPTAAQTLPYEFDVTAFDSMGLTDTAHLTLQVIVLPLSILTSSPFPPAAQGFPVDTLLELASPGGGPPYTWSQAPLQPGETALDSIGLLVTPTGHLRDSGSGPTAIGTFNFSLQVTDEPLQVVTRPYTIKINPGPVLSNITPKSVAQSGPYTVNGLNFQVGAKIKFKPGTTETVITPVFVSSTKLVFNAPVPKPVNGNGAVPVMVENPDGGNFTLNNAFVFPATNLSFGEKGFLSSPLSSTGLDVADVDGDGFAEIVHCGSVGQSVYGGSPNSTSGGLRYHKNLGTSTPSFSSTTLDGQSYYDVKFADVNTDGKLDIVGLTASTIRVWLGVGDGTFTAGPTSSQAGGYSWPSEMVIAKFNSDGVPDLAFCVSNWPSSWSNGRVHTMSGNGSGGFNSLDSAVTTVPTTYGVISITAADSDGDGRAEIVAGRGMTPSVGQPISYVSTGASGFFNTWEQRGPNVSPPNYASTTGVCTADFLGTGTANQVVATMNGSTYSPQQVMFMFSGFGLQTVTTLSAPPTRGKCCAPIDGDFDGKADLLVTGTPSAVYVYRGSTGLALSQTLDAASGTPSIAAPQLGRVASGDLNGDGRADIVATTSYWQTNGMAANYGAQYFMSNTADGGQMGIVFWLNSSN